MSKHGKKYTEASKKITPGVTLPVADALAKLKELAFTKFDESVDLHVNLGIDASKGEQVVRGSVVLPHAKGGVAKVLVFARGSHADQAQKAGADFVGTEDLIEKINSGWMDFDYAVATPDLMSMVGKVAKLLGPRGKLPNKKLGTVTFDVEEVVNDLKRGRVFFKNDKSGIVHFSFGKISFSPEKLHENLLVFTKALAAVKPPSSKGKFLRKMTITSTMGVGIQINPDDLLRS
jgi:large subunit ribosomal protein L1